MADIAGPTILSATRYEGRGIRIQYAAGASGYTAVAADVRSLTGSWAQGNQVTVLNGLIFVYSRSGVPLDPSASYQVKLRAAHTSGLPVNESGVSSVGPWVVDTPTLLAATRPNPTQIAFTYDDATVGEGAKIYVWWRTTPSGTWAQKTSFTPTSKAGTYTVQVPTADDSYELRIVAGQYGVSSRESSTRSVNAWTTPVPTLTSVTRTGPGTAVVAYSGAPLGSEYEGQLIIERYVPPLGASTYVRFSPTATSGQYTLNVGLDGAVAYDIRLIARQSGVQSAPTNAKPLEAWFSKPAGVVDLSAERRADGTVDLAWTSAATPRAPYVGQKVYRAEGDLGQLEVLPAGALTGSKKEFHDATAKQSKSYRYMVAPYNTVGEATAKPIVKSGASLNLPNSPSSTTATRVSDSTADVEWTDSSAPGREVDGYRVRRWSLGEWFPVNNNIPSTVLSWRDTSLQPNNIYKYQTQAFNAAGPAVAYSTASAEVITTPAGASRVTATRAGTTIWVEWTAPDNTIASSWNIDHTTDVPDSPGAVWYPMSAGTLSGEARRWPHESVTGSAQHTYRVTPTLAGAPEAPWVLSNRVTEFAPALAPTVIPPKRIDATGTIPLAWIHNSTDGTGLTSSSLRIKVQGAANWTVRILPGESSFDIPANTYTNGTAILWQVGTYGQDTSGLTYSDVSSFVTRARPTVAITTPNPGPIMSTLLRLGWSTNGQASWTGRLLDSNSSLVDIRSGNGSLTRETLFDTLRDRGTYTGEIVVNDGYQDSLPATVTVTVELDRPVAPLLTAIPDTAQGLVSLTTSPIQGLQLLRTSSLFLPESWTPIGGATVNPVSLALPGRLDTTAAHVKSAAGSPPSSFNASAVVLVRALVLSEETTTLTITRYEGATQASSTTVPLTAGVVAEVEKLFNTGGAVSQFRFSVPGPGSFFVWESGVIATPPPITEPDIKSFFNGDTRRPGLIYGWNPDGTAYEAVAAPDPSTANMPVALTTRIEILRDSGDGFERVGDVGDNWRLDDLIPPLGVDVTYIARSWTTQGAYADSLPVTVRIDDAGILVNWGPGWMNRASCIADIGFAKERSRAVELVEFDREIPDNFPVPFGDAGGTTKHTVGVNGSIDVDMGSSEKVWDEVINQKTVWYRDPAGRSFLANIPAVSYGQTVEGLRALSFTATQVAKATE